MILDDAYGYLGYWGTGNGNMRATKEVVRHKIIAARDLIKCHPLTPELATVQRLALATVNSKCSLYLPENTCR